VSLWLQQKKQLLALRQQSPTAVTIQAMASQQQRAGMQVTYLLLSRKTLDMETTQDTQVRARPLLWVITGP